MEWYARERSSEEEKKEEKDGEKEEDEKEKEEKKEEGKSFNLYQVAICKTVLKLLYWNQTLGNVWLYYFEIKIFFCVHNSSVSAACTVSINVERSFNIDFSSEKQIMLVWFYVWENTCRWLHTCIAYRRWGDKTSYLKNVKCSGEPRNMAALTL